MMERTGVSDIPQESWLSTHHPIRRAIVVLRVWLAMLSFMLVLNAQTATTYLIGRPLGALPFYFMAFIAFFWLSRPWESNVVIVCCALIVVGMFLRGCEVFIYADQFSTRQRLTGLSLWWFISGTTLAFGILNLIGLSRRVAEDWAWRSSTH